MPLPPRDGRRGPISRKGLRARPFTSKGRLPAGRRSGPAAKSPSPHSGRQAGRPARAPGGRAAQGKNDRAGRRGEEGRGGVGGMSERASERASERDGAASPLPRPQPQPGGQQPKPQPPAPDIRRSSSRRKVMMPRVRRPRGRRLCCDRRRSPSAGSRLARVLSAAPGGQRWPRRKRRRRKMPEGKIPLLGRLHGVFVVRGVLGVVRVGLLWLILCHGKHR